MRKIADTVAVMGMAAALLSSCTAERMAEENPQRENGNEAETVDGRQQIHFDVAMAGLTKAQPVNSASELSSSFRVTALKRTPSGEDSTYAANNYFTNMLVTRGASGWTTRSAVYWPSATDGSVLDFYAYTPAEDALSMSINGSGTSTFSGSLTGFSVDSSVAVRSHADLMVGYAYARRNRSAVVQIGFQHALSQIAVQAKSVEHLYVRVLGAKLCRIASAGALTIPRQPEETFTWGNIGTSSAYFCGVDQPSGVLNSEANPTGDDGIELNASTPVNVLSGNESFLVVPQTLTPWRPNPNEDGAGPGMYLSVLCQIRNRAGGEISQQLFPVTEGKYAFMALPIGSGAEGDPAVWEAGKKYTYTVSFNSIRGYIDPQPTDVPGPQREEMRPYVETENIGDPGTRFAGGNDVTVTVEVEPWVDAGDPIVLPIDEDRE